MYTYYFILSVFFFKQKTAYEMRISDWRSDVCSSDLAAGRQPRHRRDDDRGDGGGPGRQPDAQPLRQRDDGDDADRPASDRRPGIRQRQDARRLRPGAGAVHRHAAAQHRGPAGREEISRGLRIMTAERLPTDWKSEDRKSTRLNSSH